MNTKIERRQYKKVLPFSVVEVSSKPNLKAWYEERAEKSYEKKLNSRERAINAYMKHKNDRKITAVVVNPTLMQRIAIKALSFLLDIKFN